VSGWGGLCAVVHSFSYISFVILFDDGVVSRSRMQGR
jgi:hypothetical protein